MFATQEPQCQDDYRPEVSSDRSSSFSVTQLWHNYQYVILFDFTEYNPRPYGVFERSMFSKNEILDKWMGNTLDNPSRMKYLTQLQALPGKRFSLFGKLEKGILFFILFFIFISKITDNYYRQFQTLHLPDATKSSMF